MINSDFVVVVVVVIARNFIWQRGFGYGTLSTRYIWRWNYIHKKSESLRGCYWTTMDSNVVDRRCRCNNSRDSSRVRIVSSVSWCHGMYRKSVPIFPIFPCLLLESHSLLYSSSYLSSSMETAHQLHHHHHHRQRSWCPAQGAALVPCIEPTFPNSSSDKILTKESFELSFRYFSLRV